MTRITFAVAVAALVAFGTISLKAADEAGGATKRAGGSSHTVPYALEQIKERLGADNALTPDQEKKVQAINDEFTKKMAEVSEKAAVKAAQEEIAKAREARNYQSMRELYTKLTEAMGFNAYEDYKKALSAEGVLNEQQVAKVFPARRNRTGQKTGGEKTEAP